METIVIIARQTDWDAAQKTGHYTHSTINAALEEGGFIHCSSPTQALQIANQRYADENNLLLLFVDPTKLISPLRFEKTFPHIYGPLNVDAVYQTKPLKKGPQGKFEL